MGRTMSHRICSIWLSESLKSNGTLTALMRSNGTFVLVTESETTVGHFQSFIGLCPTAMYTTGECVRFMWVCVLHQLASLWLVWVMVMAPIKAFHHHQHHHHHHFRAWTCSFAGVAFLLLGLILILRGVLIILFIEYTCTVPVGIINLYGFNFRKLKVCCHC